MNIKECIDTVDNLKPNQYTIREKVMWLSFIEEIIINDVLKTHEGYDGRYDDFEGYTEDKISVTLIVPSPYDRLYTAYLEMKIDEANNEIARYNNSATKYNNYMSEYKKYYNKTHMPLNVLGRKNNTKPIPKPSAGLSDAELQNLINELTHNLTEYFSDTISPDKLYDIVMKYVQNNVEMLKGKDGRDGVDGKNGHTPAVGVDYFTENDKMEFLNHLQEYISSIALSEGDVTTEMIDDDAVTTTKLEDNAVTTEKIADGAVTSGKIADKAISSQHLSEEVVERIDSNKFDGSMETDEIDGYEFPEMSGSYVYKLIDSSLPDDFGGILLVASRYYKRGGITYLAKMYQTKIIVSTGDILTRQTTHTAHTQPITWSEWESVYATQKHLENTVAELAKIEDELEKQRIITSSEGESIALSDSADAQLRGLRIFGKTTQADTPSIGNPQPLESVGDDGSVDVNVHGYQLFDASAIDGKEVNGVTVTNNGDGSFTVTGVANGEFMMANHYSRKEALKLLRAGQISLSINGVYGYPYAYMSLFGTNGKYFEVNTSSATYKTRTITQEMLDDESLTMRIGIYIKSNNTTVTYLKPMLYQDGDGTWEPFKPIQTLNIPTPNGLPAVPVSSGGNYTDASGQQWVCDEKDYGREVYVQRVAEYVVTGNENWVVSTYQNSTDGRIRFDSSFAGLAAKATGDRCLCTHWVFNGISPMNVESVWVASNGVRILTNCFSTVDELKIALKAQYNSGTPVTVKYPIATPIETPLSAEEIAAYKALHTYYPSTSIHNSENAHMVVDYVADTKNYVDNQIKKEVAELTAAILTQ